MKKILLLTCIALLTICIIGSSAFACSISEINQLLDSFQVASKIKDSATLSTLVSPSFLHVHINNAVTPPTASIMNYTEYINWYIATQSSQYTDWILYNREILEHQDADKVLVSAEVYASAVSSGIARTRNLLTIARENGQCVILTHVISKYYDSTP